MAKYTCPNCDSKEAIPAEAWKCPACRRELPETPNIRAANASNEIDKLKEREELAAANCTARDCNETLEDFGKTVESASAVICRPIGEIDAMVTENRMYTGYYRQRDAGLRHSEDNKWDKIRGVADSLVFPNYEKDIIFAALSLNGKGANYYGGHSITLKDKAIMHRASVFEENTTVFCEKHNCGVKNPVPPGYRASWQNKGILAKAKLHPKITSKTTSKDYPNILLKTASGDTDDGDFIEVHIFDGFSRGAIQKISFEETSCKAEAFTIRKLKKQLEDIDVEVEVYSEEGCEAA